MNLEKKGDNFLKAITPQKGCSVSRLMYRKESQLWVSTLQTSIRNCWNPVSVPLTVTPAGDPLKSIQLGKKSYENVWSAKESPILKYRFSSNIN